MKPIRIVHFADFHLGVDTHGALDPETKLSGRVLDFLDSLDAMIDYAIEQDADLALFAGDAFHKHSPDPTLLREFGKRMVRLAEQCPVVLLVGNHDMSGVAEKASAVDVFSTLKVPNIIVGNNFQLHNIITKRGLIQVATVPYPLKNSLLTYDEKKRADSITILKNKVVAEVEKIAAEVSDDFPAVLLGHISVNSAVYGSERLMYIGEGAEIDIENLVSEVWDYVALGHIHYHQNLTEKIAVQESEVYIPPVVYAGSLDRVDFTEEHDAKGFVWVEIDDYGAKWEFVEIDARPFITLEIDVTDVDNQTTRIISKIDKSNLKDAVVRLEIYTGAGRAVSINRKRIIDALEKAGVFYIHTITVKEESTLRSRLDESVQLTAMSHFDMLRTYFQTIETPKKEMEELLKLGLDIMEEVNGEYNKSI